MKNFIFVSPHFPENYRNFCIQLSADGVNVLGIGDTPYDALHPALQEALTEYYRVDSMESYEDMYRAVAYFCFKHGRIDGLESNNEYWLEQDARLREDFNIPGMKPEELSRIKCKSGMKKYYEQAGIPCARYHLVTDLEGSLAFIEKVGYPVIVKPDNGVGAADTYKISTEEELRRFHGMDPGGVQFIMEEFVRGDVHSYDAIIDSKGRPLLETGNHTMLSIMDIVNDQMSCAFYIKKQIEKDLREAGRRCVKAFGIKSRFIHFEFFRLTADHDYLGKKGTIVGLEVNLRPSGGFSPDMMNYACSTDVYKDWADMVAFDRLVPKEEPLAGEAAEAGSPGKEPKKYYCASVGLRDSRKYVHTDEEVKVAYADRIVLTQRLPEVLAHAMGDTLYLARFETKKEMDAFFRFATKEQ